MAFESVREELVLDMLYQGQTHTVAVPVRADALDADAARAAFEAAYRAEFGRVLDGIGLRVMNLRYALIGVRPKFDLSVLAPRGASTDRSNLGRTPMRA